MSQVGYGHSDPVGMPFDFYAGAVGVAAGTNYTMATGGLLLLAAAAVTIGQVTLPLNPPDGAVAEISNVSAATASVITLTVAANSGDSLNNAALTAVTALTPTALATGGDIAATVKYKYTLNGFVVGNSQVPGAPVLNARTWFRIQ